jgi:hypothetical protein
LKILIAIVNWLNDRTKKNDKQPNKEVVQKNAKTDPHYKRPTEKMATLTRELFNEFVANKPIMVVEFFSPWSALYTINKNNNLKTKIEKKEF